MADSNEKEKELILTVRVVPRASRSEIVGESGGVLKIKIASPPVDGAANAELIKLLSKTFDVSKSRIEILSGQASRMKRVKICGTVRDGWQKF